MIPLLLAALLQAQAAPAPTPAPTPVTGVWTVADALAALKAQAAAEGSGWTLREATDANGKKSATASIRAADESGRLIVRCDTVAMPIISVQYIPFPRLPAASGGLVTVTLDEAKAEIANWEFPGGGAYYGEPVSVFILVEEIAAAKVIRVGTANAEGNVVESVFDGPGSNAMFAKVYAACGFPYATPPIPVNQ